MEFIAEDELQEHAGKTIRRIYISKGPRHQIVKQGAQACFYGEESLNPYRLEQDPQAHPWRDEIARGNGGARGTYQKIRRRKRRRWTTRWCGLCSGVFPRREMGSGEDAGA